MFLEVFIFLLFLDLRRYQRLALGEVLCVSIVSKKKEKSLEILKTFSVTAKTPKMEVSDNFSMSYVPVDRSTPPEPGDTTTLS